MVVYPALDFFKQMMTALCRMPGGHSRVSEALTTLRLNMGESVSRQSHLSSSSSTKSKLLLFYLFMRIIKINRRLYCEIFVVITQNHPAHDDVINNILYD